MSGRYSFLRAAALGTALIAAGVAQGPIAAAPAAAALSGGVAQASGAIHRTIEGQMAALARRDFAEAFRHASPQIQARFGTPQNFGEMVRQGYPMVQDAQRHVFGALVPIGSRLRQTVVITDQSGRVWIADYDMIEIDATWRIDGVHLRRAQEVGA